MFYSDVFRDEYEKAVALTQKDKSVQSQQRHVSKLMERNIYIPPHLRNFGIPRDGSKSPVSNRSSSDEDSSADPHQGLRERARRKLMKEGVLPNLVPSPEEDSLATVMNKLNVSNRISNSSNVPK